MSVAPALGRGRGWAGGSQIQDKLMVNRAFPAGSNYIARWGSRKSELNTRRDCKQVFQTWDLAALCFLLQLLGELMVTAHNWAPSRYSIYAQKRAAKKHCIWSPSTLGRDSATFHCCHNQLSWELSLNLPYSKMTLQFITLLHISSQSLPYKFHSFLISIIWNTHFVHWSSMILQKFPLFFWGHQNPWQNYFLMSSFRVLFLTVTRVLLQQDEANDTSSG